MFWFNPKQKKYISKLNKIIGYENEVERLAKIANLNKCNLMNHEKNIGGRYSIFSNVGMYRE